MITHTKLQMVILWKTYLRRLSTMLNILMNVHILMTDGENASEHVLGKKDHSEDPKKNFKAEEEPVEETPAEPEVPQVETEKVEAKLKEAEALLAKVTDASLKGNATETLAGLRK